MTTTARQLAGDCMGCGGIGCVHENGITRECGRCAGRGYLLLAVVIVRIHADSPMRRRRRARRLKKPAA